jgi:hypothetical protein
MILINLINLADFKSAASVDASLLDGGVPGKTSTAKLEF